MLDIYTIPSIIISVIRKKEQNKGDRKVMKTFNENMIENYREFGNKGEFVIEGYVVKFNNNTKELTTEYPMAKELRVWFFGLEEEEEEADKRVVLIKEHGFDEITSVVVAELEKKTTKASKDMLDKIEKGDRFFKKDNVIIGNVRNCFAKQEKKQLDRIYSGCEMMVAWRYFESIGEGKEWNKVEYKERMSK